MLGEFEESIIEGFICPVCIQPFGSAKELQYHLSLKHINNTKESASRSTSLNTTPSYTVSTIQGQRRNRTDEFLKFRRVHIDKNMLETSSLLIRLGKLLDIQNIDEPVQRRAGEQAIVPWIEAKVALCPRCGNSFGLAWNQYAAETPCPTTTTPVTRRSTTLTKLTVQKFRSATRLANALLDVDPVYRRMHHCRLCGHVICADCSYFLPDEEALRLLQVTHHRQTPHSLREVLLAGEDSKESPLLGPVKFVQRSGSELSLSKSDKPKVIRMCDVCKTVLEDKMHQVEEQMVIPPVCRLYQLLRLEMDAVKAKSPAYGSMAASLKLGESKYALEMAKTMRFELLQRLQKVDNLGKQITALLPKDACNAPTDNGQESAPMPSSSNARLIRTLGRAARQFVQMHLPPLQLLPSDTEYRQLVSQRSHRVVTKPHNESTPVRPPMPSDSLADAAWVPAHGSASFNVDLEGGQDPVRAVLLQQIDQVTGYLHQARAAKRAASELASLAANLAELESELAQMTSTPVGGPIAPLYSGI